VNIIRYTAQGKAKYGVLDGELIRGLRRSPFYRFKGRDDLSVYDGTPCLPSKVVCLGLNYRSHAEETKLPLPALPLIFLKPSTAVIGPDEQIVLPRDSRRVDYEAELGVVIGKKAKGVTQDSAGDFILGYTCVNDVTERYAQREDGQWTRAKGYDTFAPLGPGIATGLDPDDLKVETYLNGELRQSVRTSDLIFGVAELISYISNIMTLLPGDVIATGTPAGIGRMNPGDVVEVRTLRNFVVAAG